MDELHTARRGKPILVSAMGKRRIAFGYFGGKYIHLDWLLPMLVSPDKEEVYVEPFAGSMSVALNRNNPGEVIVNDLDGSVINFFRVLREQPDELIHLLSLTPAARGEWQRANKNDGDVDFIEAHPVEAARQFYVCISQSFSRRRATDKQSGWGTSRPNTLDAIESRMRPIIDALQEFRFENRDAMYILKIHGRRKGAFVYLDPPYVRSTRVDKSGYRHDSLTDVDHEAMLKFAVESDSWIAISGYESDLYNAILTGWHVHKIETTSSVGNLKHGKNTRTEVLWTNYTPLQMGGLF